MAKRSKECSGQEQLGGRKEGAAVAEPQGEHRAEGSLGEVSTRGFI